MPNPMSEELVLGKLANRRRRSRPSKSNLLWWLVLAAVVPVLAWLSYLTWAVTTTRDTPYREPRSAKEEAYRRETSLVYHTLIPVTSATLICCVGAVATIRLAGRYAKHVAVLATTIGGATVIIAVLLFAFTGAGDTVVATAHAPDFFVLYGIPVGLALIISAVTAWRMAELD